MLCLDVCVVFEVILIPKTFKKKFSVGRSTQRNFGMKSQARKVSSKFSFVSVIKTSGAIL